MTVLGTISAIIGVGTMAYGHLFVAPDLQRSVDVARRLVGDAIVGVRTVSQAAQTTDAVREPSIDVTARSVAMLDPAVALLGALDASLRSLPGVVAGRTGPVGRFAEKVLPEQGAQKSPSDDVVANIQKLRRAITELTVEARRFRTAAIAMNAAIQQHDMPSFQPDLLRISDRLHETQDILSDSNPARGATLLADLIAGIYVVIGGALIIVARAMRTLRPGPETG